MKVQPHGHFRSELRAIPIFRTQREQNEMWKTPHIFPSENLLNPFTRQQLLNYYINIMGKVLFICLIFHVISRAPVHTCARIHIKATLIHKAVSC